MKLRLSILFFLFQLSGKVSSQCYTYTVNACIDGQDYLHIQGNQLWWEHFAFSPPGTHSSCPGPVTVNGAVWAPWNNPFTLPNTTVGCSLAANIISCRYQCNIIQQPIAGNNWEGIYNFDDNAPGGSGQYVITLEYFCPTVDVGPDQTVCSGYSVNLTATGASSYVWAPPTYLSCSNCPNPTA